MEFDLLVLRHLFKALQGLLRDADMVDFPLHHFQDTLKKGTFQASSTLFRIRLLNSARIGKKVDNLEKVESCRLNPVFKSKKASSRLDLALFGEPLPFPFPLSR